MFAASVWHPVVAAHALRAGQNIVCAIVAGQELALWRSDAGNPQAWENRCPHRGVRLSLGRLLHGRLSCAYHGWEFAADSGRCEAIPALPELPVPGRVCARTYAVLQEQSMVWVRLDAAPGQEPAPAADRPQAADAPDAARLFCRALAVRAALGRVQGGLAQAGLVQRASAIWRGALAGHAVTAYTLHADAGLTLVHLWCDAAAHGTPPAALFAAARRLRADIEGEAV